MRLFVVAPEDKERRKTYFRQFYSMPDEGAAGRKPTEGVGVFGDDGGDEAEGGFGGEDGIALEDVAGLFSEDL